MERKARVDTDGFIQQCRQGYEASKTKQKIQELLLLLDLKNKENHLLQSSIAHTKEESSLKIMKLEEAVIKLQQECADLRLVAVKCKRTESEKAEQQIRAVRNECQNMMQAQQEKHIKTYRFLQEKHSEQLQRGEDKKLQFSLLNRQENEVIREIREDKSHTATMMINRLEAEKSQLLLAKRDAEAKTAFIKESYDKLKAEFQQTLNQKLDIITALKGQVQGLQLKEKMLNEKIQQDYRHFSQLKINKNNDIQHLQMANEKLKNENQSLGQLLASKNEEIMAFLKLDQREKERIIIPELPECEHIGLIKQLERNLDLKEEELRQLRELMDNWREKIGFDQPLTARFSNISKKQGTIEKLKASQTKTLKQSNGHFPKKTKK